MQKIEYYGRVSSYLTKFIFALSLLVFSLSAFFLTVSRSVAETEFPQISNLADVESLKIQEQGKYSVSMSSTTISGQIQTHVILLNTQTGQSKLHQLFYDKNGGGWKVIELSSSSVKLKIPQADF